MLITVEQMNGQCAKIADLRERESAAGAAKKIIAQELECAEQEMIGMLQDSNLPNFRGAAGLVSISARTSVKTPKTDEHRQAFFEYLKKIGLYDTMITVNSATLNSFYKDQFEQAIERGEENFEIPGLTEVEVKPILSFRK